MAELIAARGVAPSDFGSYQHAVRLVLTNDLITASRPRAGALAAVLRWADLMARDFAGLLGYTVIATAHQVRLVRRLDTVDDTQRSVFAARSGRPFDRRRLAYLCLVLAVFPRSRIEISLADLVRAFAPTANAIDGLGFDATITEHKRAVVDLLEDPDDGPALTRLPVPTADDDQQALLDRIDAGRPAGPAGEDPDPVRAPSRPGEGADTAADRPAPLQAPFVERTRLGGMLADLYNDFSAGSFTAQWQHDQEGLLAAALRLLDDLRLIRCLPGGALILPAAARYRNITAALPEGAGRDGRRAFDLFGSTGGSA